VIKHLHPSTDILFIKDELTSLGFQPRNIMNVLHRQTKAPLHMFFIDLKLDINNHINNLIDIFKLSLLCYSKINVEAPRPRKDTPQYLRCQLYVIVCMVIHALTATTTPGVFAAVIPTTHHNAKKIEANSQNAPYAVAHILPTTKVAQCTKNSAKTENSYHQTPVTKTHRTPKHVPPHNNLKKTPTWNSLSCHKIPPTIPTEHIKNLLFLMFRITQRVNLRLSSSNSGH